jgi:hypothetical protein
MSGRGFGLRRMCADSATRIRIISWNLTGALGHLPRFTRAGNLSSQRWILSAAASYGTFSR